MLDEDAFADALRDDPDETLTLLAELVGATDEGLREHARRLAGRLVVDLVRRGTPQRRGIGRLRTLPADRGGELDLERSLDAIAVSRGTAQAPALDELRARDWSRPDLAICLLVDRSGSMGGTRLATAAMAAAACLWRAPQSTTVVAFSDDALVLNTADSPRDAEAVVNDLFRLRGHGTTDLAFAMRTAHERLQSSRASRRVTILLSDARHTAGDDPAPAAALLDELLVVAPADDAEAARELATAAGGRCLTVDGPNSIVDALMAGLAP